MVDIDQAARKEQKIDWAKVGEIDAANTARLKEIIKEHGWITISKFGEETAHNAWLLVQHADKDLAFQQDCLAMMESLPEHEILQKDVAYLTDRVLMKTVGVQRYGTQFIIMPTYILVQPVEEADKLDELRIAKGMKPMGEYLKGNNLPAYLAVRQEIVLSE